MPLGQLQVKKRKICCLVNLPKILHFRPFILSSLSLVSGNSNCGKRPDHSSAAWQRALPRNSGFLLQFGFWEIE